MIVISFVELIINDRPIIVRYYVLTLQVPVPRLHLGGEPREQFR